MRGLVIKSLGSSYAVQIGDDVRECHVKGNFRIRGIRSTNPVAVGDYVQVETLPDGTSWITEVEDRKNYIIRRSTNLSKESHILAANLDQVLLMVTINHPQTSTTFIDRFLATAEAYRVPVVILFNKVDLLTEEERQQLKKLRTLYESLGYCTIATSVLQPDRPAGDLRANEVTLRELLQGKVTLLSGNSGVGKSTLLNQLFGCEMTRTGKISDAHDKGMHTTTFSAMYCLDQGARTKEQGQRTKEQGQRTKDKGPRTWIIDTPGIKGFGAVQMEKEEISHYFREVFQVGRACKYNNCLHTGEPGCAVTEAVIRGEIAESRYESYLSILGDAKEQKYR